MTLLVGETRQQAAWRRDHGLTRSGGFTANRTLDVEAHLAGTSRDHQHLATDGTDMLVIDHCRTTALWQPVALAVISSEPITIDDYPVEWAIEDAYRYMIGTVANLPWDVTATDLVDSPWAWRRTLALGHPHLDLDVFGLLAVDRDVKVRAAARRHRLYSELPDEVLAEVALIEL